jgi:uncharacterized pyridoxamine 5'-phosphate oxidase family protein
MSPRHIQTGDISIAYLTLNRNDVFVRSSEFGIYPILHEIYALDNNLQIYQYYDNQGNRSIRKAINKER